MNESRHLQAAVSDRYQIEQEIGAGGMATVYLARDVKHNRKVALKVLRPELGAVLGVERFLSEIEVTANLQHPHLLPLFDSGEADGLLFYVMPYVRGESLRDRLNRERQLPVDEAIRIAVAVASALDYAHRHNVIHRDLKPENILLHDGQPLVSDFGIALAITQAGGTRVTQTGLSLGTPQYMSPEQATGDRIIDARSDIYSLGAVVYEMLTGEAPHIGGTVQAIIAKVLTDRPQSVRHLRDTVPAHVDAAIMCALAKLPADRFATASEFADALTGARVVTLPAPSTTVATYEVIGNDPASRRRRRILQVIPWAVALAAVAFAANVVREPEPQAPAPLRAELTFADSVRPITPAGQTIAISQDGSMLAFVGRGPEGMGIYVRSLMSTEDRLVRGTDGGTAPVFSPDGTSLLYSVSGQLKRAPLGGGASITLADSSGLAPFWSPRNGILFGVGSSVYRIPPEGGQVEVVAERDTTRGHRRYAGVHVLPDGKHALLSLSKGPGDSQIGVLRFSNGQVTELGVPGVSPRYVPGGYIIWGSTDGTVFGARFSERTLRIAGPAVPLLEGVMVKFGGAMELTVSDNGTLVYKTSVDAGMNRLVRVTRRGAVTPLPAEPRLYTGPRVSPDGRRIATQVTATGSGADIWTYDLLDGTLLRTTTGASSERPSWLRDGNRIGFLQTDSAGRAAYVAKAWDGTGATETIVEATDTLSVDFVFGPIGGYHVFKRGRVANIWDIWIAPVDSLQAMRPFLNSPAQESSHTLSPDGRFIAYSSNESGRREVYVRPLPGPGSLRKVSLAGGDEPVWSRDGREIFYRANTWIMAATVVTRPELQVTRRDSLFRDQYIPNGIRTNYDVFPNGDFLFVSTPRSTGAVNIVAIANWITDVRKRLGD